MRQLVMIELDEKVHALQDPGVFHDSASRFELRYHALIRIDNVSGDLLAEYSGQSRHSTAPKGAGATPWMAFFER
jgi:hypothetical protein